MKQYLCILWSLDLCQKNIPWQHLLSPCLTSVQLVLVTELCYTWKVRSVFCKVLLLSSFPSLQPWCFCPAEELVWQTREVASFVPQPAVILILLPKGGVGKGRFWTLVSSGPLECVLQSLLTTTRRTCYIWLSSLRIPKTTQLHSDMPPPLCECRY